MSRLNSMPQGVVVSLPVVLALVFEREELARLCWGPDNSACLAYWPSSFYHLAADRACNSPNVWLDIRDALDARLHPWMRRLQHVPPVELTRLFVDAPAVLQGLELAAALWVLVREADPAFDTLLQRNRQELELSFLGCARSQTHSPHG